MKILAHFRHFKESTEGIEDYIEKKLSKLLTFNKDLMEAHIDIHAGKEHTAPNKYLASANLHLPPKHIIHAEAKGQTPQASVDALYEELKREIEKHNKKNNPSRKEREERKNIKNFL